MFLITNQCNLISAIEGQNNMFSPFITFDEPDIQKLSNFLYEKTLELKQNLYAFDIKLGYKTFLFDRKEFFQLNFNIVKNEIVLEKVTIKLEEIKEIKKHLKEREYLYKTIIKKVK